MPRYTMVEVALELGDHAFNSDLLAAQPTLAGFWTVLTRGYWCVAHSGMRWAAVCISASLQPWLHDFPADHGIDITSVPRFAPSSNGYFHRNAVAPLARRDGIGMACRTRWSQPADDRDRLIFVVRFQRRRIADASGSCSCSAYCLVFA
jgi:hypothetical protein